MKIKSPQDQGFTEVLFAQGAETPPDNPTIEEKQSIIFIFPTANQLVAKTALFDFLQKLGGLPTKDEKNHKYLMQITGKGKVVQAIEVFLKDKEYKVQENKELTEKLTIFLIKLHKLQKENPKTRPAKIYQLRWFEKDLKKIDTEASAHPTKLVQEIKNPDNKYINKDFLVDRSIVEAEAFNGFCYWLAIGKRAARVTTVVDELGKRSSNSELFPNFYSLSQYYKAHKGEGPDDEILIGAGLADILVADLVEQENDNHAGNSGFGSEKIIPGETKIDRLDFDQVTYLITAKYLNRLLDSPQGNYYKTENGRKVIVAHKNVKIKDAFSLTARDIRNLPLFKDYKPFNGLHKIAKGIFVGNKVVEGKIQPSKIGEDLRFIEQKHFALLKRALIPDEIYQVGARLYFGSKKLQRKFCENKINRTKELKEILVCVPEFKQYLSNNPQAIEFVKKDCEQRRAELLVDIQKLEKEIEQIENRINQLRIKQAENLANDAKLTTLDTKLNSAKLELERINNELAVTKELYAALSPEHFQKNYSEFKSFCENYDMKKNHLVKEEKILVILAKLKEIEANIKNSDPRFLAVAGLITLKKQVVNQVMQNLLEFHCQLQASLHNGEKLNLTELAKQFGFGEISLPENYDLFSYENLLSNMVNDLEKIKADYEKTALIVSNGKFQSTNDRLYTTLSDVEQQLKNYSTGYVHNNLNQN